MHSPEIQHIIFYDDGIFMNNPKLPAIAIFQAIPTGSPLKPEQFESLFSEHGWENSWRNGLYGFHHYHSTAHEVLGIYSGWVRVLLGGAKGTVFTLHAGDVLILPAGVSHMNIAQSPDFMVVGAYPQGQSPDMNYGRPGERPLTDNNILTTKLPKSDPVFGNSGPVHYLWIEVGHYQFLPPST